MDHKQISIEAVRRKRRDVHWERFRTQSETKEQKLKLLMKKYFARERNRVLLTLKRFVGIKAATLQTQAEDEPWPDLNLLEIESALEGQMEANGDDWEDALLALFLVTADTFASDTAAALGYRYEETPTRVRSWIERHLGELLALLIAYSLRRILQQIAEAQAARETIAAVLARINSLYVGFIRSRSTRVANEIGLIASIAQQLTILSLPVDHGTLMQTWLSMRDEKVRESHENLDGQERQLGQEFKSGLKFPRDPNAPASETVNCRCWLMIEQQRQRRAA